MKFNLDTLKNAAMTTAVVLAVVWTIRRTEVGKKVVATALAG